MSCDIGELMERLENEQSFSYITSSSLNSPSEPPMLSFPNICVIVEGKPWEKLNQKKLTPPPLSTILLAVKVVLELEEVIKILWTRDRTQVR